MNIDNSIELANALFQPITALNEDTPASGTSLMEEEVMEADSGIHERAHNRARFN